MNTFSKFLSLLLLFNLTIFGLQAQTVTGTWISVDDEEGDTTSYIKIYEENGMFFGKVEKTLRKNASKLCTKCKDHRKDQPIEGMIIISDMKAYEDYWSYGKILDPKTGKEYKCRLILEDKNTLDVRGYMGTPLFGRSQTWFRKQ